MDQPKARETAKDAAEQVSRAANEAVQRVGEEVQPALDRGKAAVQDFANQASEAGRQVADRAGEFIESATSQLRQAGSNLSTKVLVQDSTSASMPRSSLSQRC